MLHLVPETYLQYFFNCFFQMLTLAFSKYSMLTYFTTGTPSSKNQKQPSRIALMKRCSGNMHQMYWRIPVPKSDLFRNFIEITLRHRCSPINLLHIFRTPFSQNTSGWLLLKNNMNDL